LLKDDDALLEEIFKVLTDRVQGDPYASDGTYAANLALLPAGLRAMAATHWLDVSLTLDSVTWHFGNFGEAGLVAQTRAGLLELGLHGLATVFCEARDLMIPLLDQRTSAEATDPYELLEENDLGERGRDLDRRAWAIDDRGTGKSVIYDAWVRYARAHPAQVFGN
jgi:hypothetical protein